MAHRGGRHGGDPNTIDAIRHSCDVGATSAEIDVNETSDGVLLATHDSVVQPGAWVSDYTFAELVDLDADEWSRRRLEEVIDYTLSRSAVAYLDIKSITPEGLKHITQSWPDAVEARQILFAAARGEVVAWIGSNLPSAATSFLYYDRLLDLGSLGAYMSPDYLHPCFDHLRDPFRTVNEDYVDRVRSLGCGLVSWNENDQEAVQQLTELGFDFICTDDPGPSCETVNAVKAS